MANVNMKVLLRITAFSGVVLLGVSIILNVLTGNILFYAGIMAGIVLMVYSIIASRFSKERKADERYQSIREKASHLTLMVLFIAGPIIICMMLFSGTFLKIVVLEKLSNTFTIPLLLIYVVYYISVFYYRRKFGE